DAQGFLQYHAEEGLRTSEAVSEAVNGGQVLASIIMFGLIYLLLLAVWVYVMNHKIHVGPQDVVLPEVTTGEHLLEAVAERVEHEFSMTEAKYVSEGAD